MIDRPADFELYDNVGRTTEQINAYNTGTPTEDDLRRWARTDRLDPPGRVLAAWSQRLAASSDPSEFQKTLREVLDGEDDALGRLHQFLETAQIWCEEHGHTQQAHRFQAAAETLQTLYEDLALAQPDSRTSPAPAAVTPPAPKSTPGRHR
ncbi:hypothetical protein G4Z16_00865 [Streptomyces bathyalis]|uniref:Uncharacterized protein n=1 Tax=Streptomyces bathyalis TaxID=2710756 RepID=A0A7T1T2J5_9ACTN|nr:hypothetical protein [Streptomyces bathyalis]QPP05178.1 hypothetical protein G4Z16_00865 [Streptomyces bathyalis]